MKISRDNQISFADFALRLLARGICAVSMFDKRVASDLGALGDGFSFAICAGLGEQAAAIRLITENGRFVRTNAESEGSDIVIRFKDVSGLMPVITGKKSVETAFAQHRMLVFGNISQAVILVRIIDIAEAYLFPKFMIKKAMRRIPPKQVPSLFVYIALLFFGVRKPPQTIASDSGGQPEAVAEQIPDQDTEVKDELEAVK